MVIKIVTLVHNSKKKGACFKSECEKVLCDAAPMSAQRPYMCEHGGYQQIDCDGCGSSIGAVTSLYAYVWMVINIVIGP